MVALVLYGLVPSLLVRLFVALLQVMKGRDCPLGGNVGFVVGLLFVCLLGANGLTQPHVRMLSSPGDTCSR